jgi:hypothetical protein
MESKQPTTKRIALFSYLILAIIALLCIINYLINQTLNWSLYPIGALIMIWATLAPVNLPQYRLLGCYMGLSVTLIPYLYLVAHVSGDGAWFWPLAFPLAISFLGVLGLFTLSVYQLVNKWFRGAVTFFLFGVVLNYTVGAIIEHYLQEHNLQGEITNRFTLIIFLIVTIIFSLIGSQSRSKS